MAVYLPARTLSPFTTLGIAWCAFAVLLLALTAFQVDTRLADWLYRLQGDSWLLRRAFFTEVVLHEGGRRISQVMASLVLVGLLVSHSVPAGRPWRRPLAYLLTAVALSTLTIAIVKHLVSMDCPWDLIRYGGSREFVGLFQRRPVTYPDVACFPSGHASAGYAWIALYYFFHSTLPRWRWMGLALALSLGLVFGIGQQLRGAHFLSHDLWTLMLCWTLSFVLATKWLPDYPLSERSADALSAV